MAAQPGAGVPTSGEADGTEEVADLLRALGRQIKVARERAGLSQKELGDRLGYGEETISSVERARRTPQPELLENGAVGGLGGRGPERLLENVDLALLAGGRIGDEEPALSGSVWTCVVCHPRALSLAVSEATISCIGAGFSVATSRSRLKRSTRPWACTAYPPVRTRGQGEAEAEDVGEETLVERSELHSAVVSAGAVRSITGCPANRGPARPRARLIMTQQVTQRAAAVGLSAASVSLPEVTTVAKPRPMASAQWTRRTPGWARSGPCCGRPAEYAANAPSGSQRPVEVPRQGGHLVSKLGRSRTRC